MHCTKYIIKLFSTLHYVASVENTNQAGFQYSVLTSCPFLVKGHLSYIGITTCSIDILIPFFVSYSPDLDCHWSLVTISFFLEVITMTRSAMFGINATDYFSKLSFMHRKDKKLTTQKKGKIFHI